MATENTLRDQEHPDFNEYYGKVQSSDLELKNYVRYGLLSSENLGLIDRGYYDPDGVIDEVYLMAFQDYDNQIRDAELRTLLFRHAMTKLDQLIVDEVETPNEPSTGGLLKDELDTLDERFLVDLDGDLIMQDELDDISYKQERRRNEHIYLDEKLIENIVERFQLDDKFTLAKNKRIHLGLLYSSLPSISRSIVELYVYGHQEKEDIVRILEVEDASVSRVLKIVREKFRLI